MLSPSPRFLHRKIPNLHAATAGISIASTNIDHNHNLRFAAYCCFAFGIPSVLSVLAVAVDLSPLTSYDVVKPNFGKMSCWFYGENLERAEIFLRCDDLASLSGRPSVVYYFFVPVVSLMAANIVLFVLTSLIVNGYKNCWTGRCVEFGIS